MTMHTSSNGLRLIEGFEGFSATQYNDGTGVMTIGFGTTSADVSPLPTFLTRAQAEALLQRKLAEKYEPAVNGLNLPFNQNQFDALVSLAYNCGPGIVSDQFAIGRDLRARNYGAAADDFLHYVFAGGRALAGLVTRRRTERLLFLTKPAPPPDPFHYERFPTGPWRLSGREIPERATVELHDRLAQHGRVNWLRLRFVRRDIGLLRKRVWTVAHFDRPPSWDQEWRGWRWQELAKRSR